MSCCARSARPDQHETRYQSVCSWRSSPRPVTRFTATLNSHTGRPFGVILSSGSRPTLPMMMILLTEATRLLVPSHHDVAQDVLGEADGALELAGLVWWELELEHAVVPVTVMVDLVCDTGHMPMFPVAMTASGVTLECANRHRVVIAVPDDPKLRRFVQNWVARKGAQLDEQHRRWEAERDD